jgi:HTH-type transcriptional regulator/antitoxin HigA
MNAASPDLIEVARSYAEFRAIAGVGAVRNEADYSRTLAMVEAILDETRNQPAREDATHPLADLLDLLSASLRNYEADHYPIPAQKSH